jgi:DNA polymerase
MDNATRLQYLEAMGITVWETRRSPIPPCISSGNPDASQLAPFATQATLAANQDKISQISSPAGHTQLLAHHQHDHEQDWLSLQQQVAACRNCGLCETRTQTVFGVGNRQPGWMLIGEAPGQDEDLQGEPFVGRAGQLLNEMLRAIGLRRDEVYIANMLKCRPPHNRDPEATEIAACRDYLHRQIQLLRPKLIMTVGRIAAQNLLNTQQSLTKLRGARYQYADTPVVVIHHPSYLLRSPLEKAKAWEDLQYAWTVYNTLE